MAHTLMVEVDVHSRRGRKVIVGVQMVFSKVKSAGLNTDILSFQNTFSTPTQAFP